VKRDKCCACGKFRKSGNITTAWISDDETTVSYICHRCIIGSLEAMMEVDQDVFDRLIRKAGHGECIGVDDCINLIREAAKEKARNG